MEELSQHILDIVCNSIEAGATELVINVLEDITANTLEFTVLDNGRGVTDDEIPTIIDPFFTTKKHKRVGLGIPLLQEAVQRCDGFFEIKSRPPKGTSVTAAFPYNHLDRAPLGDIATTIISLITANSTINITYQHSYNGSEFLFNTLDFKSLLGDVPLQTPEVLVWLRNYLDLNIAKLKEGNH